MALAAGAPGASQVVTGILGFLVVAAMALALVFLLRSMNKQLGKVVSGPDWRRRGAGTGQPGAGQARADGIRPDSGGPDSGAPDSGGPGGAAPDGPGSAAV